MNKIPLLLLLFLPTFLFGQEDQLAQRYLEQGKYTEALEIYQELYKKNPSPFFYARIVSIYRSIPDYEEGVSFVKNDLRKNKRNELQNRADLLFFFSKLNDDKSFSKEYSNLEKTIASQPALIHNLQRILSERGLFKEALNLIIVAENNDRNLRLTYQKALMYAEMGQLEEMYITYIDLIDETAGYLNTVKSLFSRSLETDPDDKYNIFIKENLLKRIQKKENEYLVELLIHVFLHEENYGAALQQRIAQDRRRQGDQSDVFRLGKVAREKKDFNTAFQAFDYIIEQKPPSPYSDAAIVERFITSEEELSSRNAGNHESEYRELAKAVRGFINDHNWQFPGVELARVLARVEAFGLGNYQAASSALKRMDEVNRLPAAIRVDGKLLLGDIQLMAGKYTEALLAYAQAEKLAGDQPLADEAKLRMGKVAYFQGDFTYALNTFDVLKASTSKHTANDAMRLSLLIRENTMLDTNYVAMTMFAQADLFFFRKMYEKALRELRILSEDFPKHTLQDEILLLKGKIHFDMGNYQLAVEAWERMLSEHPGGILSDEGHLRAGEVYRDHLKNNEKALYHFETILTDYPNSYYVSEARRLYRSLRGDLNF